MSSQRVDHSQPDVLLFHAELPPELKHGQRRDFALYRQHWARQRGLATISDDPSGLCLFTGLQRPVDEGVRQAVQDWARAEPLICAFRLSPPFSLCLLATGQQTLDFAPLPTGGLLRFLTAGLYIVHAMEGGNKALASGLLAALPLLPQDPPRKAQ